LNRRQRNKLVKRHRIPRMGSIPVTIHWADSLSPRRGKYHTALHAREGNFLFWWLEGNAACDCNRSSFFGLPERDCGYTIKLTRIRVLDSDFNVWRSLPAPE